MAGTGLLIKTRLLDLLVPGAGTLYGGAGLVGWGAIVSWAAILVGAAFFVCTGGVHPVKIGVAVAVTYAAFQVLLALEPAAGREGGAARAAVGLLMFAGLVLGGVLGLRGSCRLVVVNDLCNFPGLLPGEVVAVVRSRDFGKGDMVAARAGDRWVLARIVGKGGDRVQLSGPSLTVNGAVVGSEELGGARLNARVDVPAYETKSLRVYREDIGGSRHAFFFRRNVDVAPAAYDVPGGTVFLLCDNRSTADAADSRELGPFMVKDVFGAAGRVVWSAGPDGPRLDRLGAAWR